MENKMATYFTETNYEQAIIELFQNMGYSHIYGPNLERDYTSPILESTLFDCLVQINKNSIRIYESIDRTRVRRIFFLKEGKFNLH